MYELESPAGAVSTHTVHTNGVDDLSRNLPLQAAHNFDVYSTMDGCGVVHIYGNSLTSVDERRVSAEFLVK